MIPESQLVPYQPGSIQNHSAVYSPSPSLNGLNIDADLMDEVNTGVTIGGAALGALILAGIFGGRSRLFAAAGGAGGAIVGAFFFKLIANRTITYVRKTGALVDKLQETP